MRGNVSTIVARAAAVVAATLAGVLWLCGAAGATPGTTHVAAGQGFDLVPGLCLNAFIVPSHLSIAASDQPGAFGGATATGGCLTTFPRPDPSVNSIDIAFDCVVIKDADPAGHALMASGIGVGTTTRYYVGLSVDGLTSIWTTSTQPSTHTSAECGAPQLPATNGVEAGTFTITPVG